MNRKKVESILERLGGPGITARQLARCIVYIRRMPWGDSTLDEYLPDLAVGLARRVLGLTKPKFRRIKGRKQKVSA